MFLISSPDKATEAIARTQWSLMRPYLDAFKSILGDKFQSISQIASTDEDYTTAYDLCLSTSIRGIYVDDQNHKYEIELKVINAQMMRDPLRTYVKLSIREADKVGLNGFILTMDHDYNESSKLDHVESILNCLSNGGLSVILTENVFNYDLDFIVDRKDFNTYAVSNTVSAEKVITWIPAQSVVIKADAGCMNFTIECLLPPLVGVSVDDDTSYEFDKYSLEDMSRMNHNLLDSKKVMDRVLQAITPKEEVTQGE